MISIFLANAKESLSIVNGDKIGTRNFANLYHLKVRACEHVGITPINEKKEKPKRKCII